MIIDLPIRRLIPGDWKLIPPEPAMRLSQRFRDSVGPSFLARFDRAELRLERVRAMPLSCYPRHLLCEQQVMLYGEVTAAAFIFGDEGVTLIDGSSAPLHDLNEALPLNLEDDKSVREYIRLFCSAVHGGDGRFQLIENEEDLAPYLEGDTATFARYVVPTALHKAGDHWRLKGTVRYGRNIFKAEFRLERSGNIEMVDDEPLDVELPSGPDRFNQYFRGLPVGREGE